CGTRRHRHAAIRLRDLPRNSRRGGRHRARRPAAEGHGDARLHRRRAAQHAGQHGALAARPAGRRPAHGDAQPRRDRTRRARSRRVSGNAQMRRARTLILLLLVPAAGCRGMQHALDPVSGEAAFISNLSWLLYCGATLIFVTVMALAAYAIFGPRGRNPLAHRNLIIGGGIVFPAVTLTALMIYAFVGAPNLLLRGEPELHIEVTGEQFWWRMRYLDAAGKAQFETANEIVIPAGTTVAFHLRTADVIHSFWVPNLHGKLDMIPGHPKTMHVHAERTGQYRGQCAEYCGTQHAKMAFGVKVGPAGAFEQW